VIKKNLFFKNNIHQKYLNSSFLKKSVKEFEKIIQEINIHINSSTETLSVLSKNYRFNFQTKDLKNFKKFKSIAIIGMGGSVLGSEAIYNFLEKKIKKKVYFFDDLNSNKIVNLRNKENLNKILFLIISKSGNTIETLSNTFTLNIVKKNAKNIIVISERKDNLLFSFTKKLNLFYVEHEENIGGRYSVLSEVGIIPAYLMGVNIIKLRSETLTFLKKKRKLFLKESTMKLASLLNSKKINNLIFLNYAPQLEKFLYWCQQLIAESLGKEGKGFMPMISNVPRDHHSLLQLYLDGPRNKLFHIFSIEEKLNIKLNTKKIFKKNFFLENQTLHSIKVAQKNALIKAFKKKKIPYREFKIKEINAQVLGELFSYFILETVIIGKLSKINPFNQPAVEQVKVYTKKFLT
jgi:glucose-6-phosphate isomerase